MQACALFVAVCANCAFAGDVFPSSFSLDDAEALNMIQLRASVARVDHTGDGTASDATAIFVAGLEGCGHGFLMELWRQLRTAGINIEDVVMPEDWDCYAACEWNKTGGEGDMIATFQGLEEGQVYMLKAESYPYGTDFDHDTNITTPNCHDDRLYRRHPHMDWISEAASYTSVDFRVLFLYRPIDEVLAANCLHRRWEPTCTLLAETLAKNAEYLMSQLSDVQARGYPVQCMMYGDVPEMIQSIGDSLGMDAELSKIINDVWQPSSRPEQEEFPGDWSQAMDIVRTVDTELHKLCKAIPRISDSSNFLEMIHYSGPVL